MEIRDLSLFLWFNTTLIEMSVLWSLVIALFQPMKRNSDHSVDNKNKYMIQYYKTLNYCHTIWTFPAGITHFEYATSKFFIIVFFLKTQVKFIFQNKIDEIHKAVSTGNLRDVQHLIDRKKLAFCRDQMGASPMHKAVLFQQKPIIDYLLNKYPSVVHARDHVSLLLIQIVICEIFPSSVPLSSYVAFHWIRCLLLKN